MSILLKNSETADFLDEANHWTHDIRKARSFDTTERAMQHCRSLHFVGVNIVLKFLDPQYDLELEDCCR